MVDSRIIDDITRRLADAVPESARLLQKDLEKSFRAILNNAFARLDLVTREELEVQEQVLARTRDKLESLEARLKALETALRAREQEQPEQGGDGPA